MKLKRWLKHLFLPQKENNYRAKILHPSFLAFFVFLFLAQQTLINFVALARPGVLGYSSEITPEKIIELTNQERQKHNLPPLETNSLLNEAARRKAGDMFAFDYWAHKSPSGREPWSFLKEVGYDYRVAGENLARDFSEPGAVVQAWMRSPSHRENILNPKFKEIGVAVVDGTLGGIRTTLVVQFFGTPTNYVAGSEEKRPITLTEEEQGTLAKPQIPSTLGENKKPLVSPLGLTRSLSAFLFGLITGALIIDGYLVVKKKVYRSVGRTTAHAGFLAVMFLLILLSQPGVIN